MAPTVWLASILSAVPFGACADGPDRPDVSSRVITMLPGQGSPRPPVVTALSIQPGGRLLATGGDDHVVRLWDLVTGELVRELGGHVDWIRDADFSPDGHDLATAGNDRCVWIWDVESGRRRAALRGFPEAIAKIAYSQDGRRLAVAGFERQMHIYDIGQGGLTRQVYCPCRDMRAVAFAPRGNYLAAGGRNGRVRIWSTAALGEHRDFDAHRQRVRALTFDADGRRLVSAGEDRVIRVWEVETGRLMFELPSPGAKVLSMAICPSGILATAGSDNSVRLWDLHRQRPLQRLEGHTGSVAALACDGQVLVSGSFDTTVRCWSRAALTPRCGSGICEGSVRGSHELLCRGPRAASYDDPCEPRPIVGARCSRTIAENHGGVRCDCSTAYSAGRTGDAKGP
jgi:WD40 repeat protein